MNVLTDIKNLAGLIKMDKNGGYASSSAMGMGAAVARFDTSMLRMNYFLLISDRGYNITKTEEWAE
jgi:hypothetical protein